MSSHVLKEAVLTSVYSFQRSLVNFRRFLIVQEPKQFNDVLEKVCKICRKRNFSTFFDFLMSKKLSLISKSEAVDRFHIPMFLLLLSFIQ